MKHGNQGLFIAIEGTDGSGKSTQLRLLADRLQAAGYEAVTLEFPLYDQPSSYFVRQYLAGAYGRISDVSPYAASLFFSLDRFEAADDIKAAVKAGKIVIVSRFTGSNMAYMGSRFSHPEQRRSYFFWLDNLEANILGIPRPDMSIVLRVNADTAQKLRQTREESKQSPKPNDIHEGNPAYLQQSIKVFDDLCHLFPKDFSCIDCIRSGALMSIESVNDHLWKSIEPLLPPPAQKPSKRQATTLPLSKASSTDTSTYGKTSSSLPADPAAQRESEVTLTLESASQLLLQQLSPSQFGITVELNQEDDPSGKPPETYFMPDYFDKQTADKYAKTMNAIFRSHAEIIHKLSGKRGRKPASRKSRKAATEPTREQIQDISSAVLPLAAISTADITGTLPALEKLGVYFLAHELQEARAIGEQLLNQLHKLHPEYFKQPGYLRKTSEHIKHLSETYQTRLELGKKHLSDNYAPLADAIQLVSYWPKDENDLLAEDLFEYSNLSYKAITEQIAQWPNARKQKAMESLLNSKAGNRQNNIHEGIYYSWDIVDEFKLLNDYALRQVMSNLRWQPLTPRYGYDVPSLIEQNGLSDTFEECFDASLKLHSQLQAGGYDSEAQYATLLGHRARVKFDPTLEEFRKLAEVTKQKSKDSREYQLVENMKAQIQKAHPLIGSLALNN